MRLILQNVIITALTASALSTAISPATQTGLTDRTAMRVDSLLARFDEPGSPGVAVAVLSRGHVVYMRGHGLANLEYCVPITPETIFNVASVSKQVTAFSIVLLTQQGELDLDEDIRTYLPELPDFGEIVTLRHLIHHTSGLRGILNSLTIAGWQEGDVVTKKQITRMIRSQRELNYKPGDEYLYVNTGYVLIVEIVERVTGQPFDEWTKTHIFAPLDMNDTVFCSDFEQVIPNRAYSYHESERDGGTFKKSVSNINLVGPSGLYTTAADLVKWIQNFDDARVGGRCTIEQMHVRGTLNNGDTLSYAYGLIINEYRGLKRISHEGSIAGFRSCVARFPDQALAVIVLSNVASTDIGRLTNQ
ncbi:MAG: beta-lactamase family protein, partial [Candidatus Eiseniibacteriota bacterium]